MNASGHRRRFIAQLGLTAAACTVSGPAGAQTTPKLRVAMIPIDAGAASGYALEQGFFAKYGLDVELVTGGNGATVAAAVAGGSLDIGNGNTLSIATAHERGVPFVYIAPSGAWSSKTPTGALIVAGTSPFRSAKDLAGKVVAVTIVRGLAEIAVRAWIDKTGGNSESVKFVEMPYSEMGPAVASGRIDAASVEEPALSNFLATGMRALANVSDAIAPLWVQGGYFCTLDFAKAHPDVVKKFAAAMTETAIWANKNHDATAKILEKYSKTPVNPATHRMFYPERLRAEDLQPLIDAAVRYGVLKVAFPAKELIAPGV